VSLFYLWLTPVTVGADTTLLLLSDDYVVAAPYRPSWWGSLLLISIISALSDWVMKVYGSKECWNISLYCSDMLAGEGKSYQLPSVICQSKTIYFPLYFCLSAFLSPLYLFSTFPSALPAVLYFSVSLFFSFKCLSLFVIFSSFAPINNYWAVSSFCACDWH
jgi:hypothetical protein